MFGLQPPRHISTSTLLGPSAISASCPLFGDQADSICSIRDFPGLTPSRPRNVTPIEPPNRNGRYITFNLSERRSISGVVQPSP
jgi:hypothetical protein